MKTLTTMGDKSNKVTDTSTVFKFIAWDDGVPQDLTSKTVTATIANASGYLFDEKIKVNGTELDLDFSSDNLKTLTPDIYQLEISVSDNQGNTEIYPSEGTVSFTVFKNLKLTQGELVPQITFDSVLKSVDEKIMDYVTTIKKGEQGEQGRPGEQGVQGKPGIDSESHPNLLANSNFAKGTDGWILKSTDNLHSPLRVFDSDQSDVLSIYFDSMGMSKGTYSQLIQHIYMTELSSEIVISLSWRSKVITFNQNAHLWVRFYDKSNKEIFNNADAKKVVTNWATANQAKNQSIILKLANVIVPAGTVRITLQIEEREGNQIYLAKPRMILGSNIDDSYSGGTETNFTYLNVGTLTVSGTLSSK